MKTGRATFTQTVTSPDGAKKKSSSGSFEFARPNRFRFAYAKPFEQTIVADGEKVWIYDARPEPGQLAPSIGQALGATPAALLAGGSLEQRLRPREPAGEGRPRLGRGEAEGEGRRVPVGRASASRARPRRALEIIDSFGQHSLLRFERASRANVRDRRPRRSASLSPAGADVIEQ